MAVTVSISATKIDITSTGGVQETFGTCVTAINTNTAGTITGSGTSVDPWIITAAAYRELEISNACKVLFEADTYLYWNWSNTSGTYVVMDFATGSETVIEQNCVFNFGYVGTYTRGYVYVYGKLTIQGTSGNEVIWKNMRSIYFYPRGDQDWDYLKIQDSSYSVGYIPYLTYSNNYILPIPTVHLNHITIEDTRGTYNGRFYWLYSGNPIDTYLFENFSVDHITYPIYLASSNGKFINSTFKNSSVQAVNYNSGNGIGLPFNTSKSVLHNQKTFQPMSVFDGCTFDNCDAGSYGMTNYYAGRILYKDCTFMNQITGLYASYGHLIFLQGTTTFTNVTNHKLWSNQGTYLHVREVKITVEDLDGNPVEGAVVGITQDSSTPKEWHSGTTDSNGQLLNVWGRHPLFVEKEEYSNGNYYQWSNDTSSGLSHTIVVTKKGYQVEQRTIEVTEDKDLTFTLTPIGDGATTLYDSTVYDSTFY